MQCPTTVITLLRTPGVVSEKEEGVEQGGRRTDGGCYCVLQRTASLIKHSAPKGDRQSNLHRLTLCRNSGQHLIRESVTLQIGDGLKKKKRERRER